MKQCRAYPAQVKSRSGCCWTTCINSSKRIEPAGLGRFQETAVCNQHFFADAPSDGAQVESCKTATGLWTSCFCVQEAMFMAWSGQSARCRAGEPPWRPHGLTPQAFTARVRSGRMPPASRRPCPSHLRTRTAEGTRSRSSTCQGICGRCFYEGSKRKHEAQKHSLIQLWGYKVQTLPSWCSLQQSGDVGPALSLQQQSACCHENRAVKRCFATAR